MNRDAEISAFLSRNGWANARRTPLAADASDRQYFRLIAATGGETAVLMDAPPATNGSQGGFVDIANWLSGAGFSAPEILASDLPAGLVLCEDLSDRVFSSEIRSGRLKETLAYRAATEMLLALHKCAPPGNLPVFTPQSMAAMIAPAFEFYAPDNRNPRLENQLIAALDTVLHTTWLGGPVMILRDCHADNLLWLPDRPAHKKTGILDFQDAVTGHPAYDLVSLLFDVRRDVDPDLAEELIRHFAGRSGFVQSDFRAACAAQSAQRNLRILGVFARLAAARHKPGYLRLLPAVWRRLCRDLAHPALAELQDLVLTALPEPTERLVTL